MATFGINKNGTLSRCKAKPENRGKGSCTHVGHSELSPEDSTKVSIQAYNEKVLAESYGIFVSRSRGSVEGSGTRALKRQEFQKATQQIAVAFPQEDWNSINRISQDLTSKIEEQYLLDHQTNAIQNIHSY